MEETEESTGQSGMERDKPRSKVGRVIRDYGLTGGSEELERRWLGDGEPRQSLRELADFFNRQVLQAAIEDVDGQPIEGEVSNLYRLLTADDVGASARTQAETKLSRMGLDVEAIRGDFVSHQAIHRYLTKVRDVSAPDNSGDRGDAVDNRRQTILRLRNRLVAVTERSLESLRDAGHLSLGTFDAIVTVTVYCNDCGSSYDFADLLRQRGCDCPDEVG